MNENSKRMQIEEEAQELISGGKLYYGIDDGGTHVYSLDNPDMKYRYTCQWMQLIQTMRGLPDDDGIRLQKLLDAGLIWPM